MAIINKDIYPIITKSPKAFLGFARLHNLLVKSVRPVLNIKSGYKIKIVQTEDVTTISFKG